MKGKLTLNNYFIIILLFIIFSYSKTTNTNPILSNYIKSQNFYPREDEFDIIENIERLKKREKVLEDLIYTTNNKNQDYKIQIEINKIYVKILYSIIFILLFVIFIIIVIKFYCKCKKVINSKNIIY